MKKTNKQIIQPKRMIKKRLKQMKPKLKLFKYKENR